MVRMGTLYIAEALSRAAYELIEDEEPFYGEIPGLQGVWATGLTLKACEANLQAALEDWMLLSREAPLSWKGTRKGAGIEEVEEEAWRS